MSGKSKITPFAKQPTVYQVTVRGHLNRHWSQWFGGLTISCNDNGESQLTGVVADQAALHGILRKVRDLGMPLVSLKCLQTGRTVSPEERKS